MQSTLNISMEQKMKGVFKIKKQERGLTDGCNQKNLPRKNGGMRNERVENF